MLALSLCSLPSGNHAYGQLSYGRRNRAQQAPNDALSSRFLNFDNIVRLQLDILRFLLRDCVQVNKHFGLPTAANLSHDAYLVSL